MYKALRLRIKNARLRKRLRAKNEIVDFSKFANLSNGVLIIDTSIPEYNKDSGSRRLYHIIKLILDNNRPVFLMADKKEYKYDTQYVEFYERLGAIVYRPCLDEDGKFISRNTFIQKISGCIGTAWLHRPMVFYRYADFIRKNSRAKLIFDMVDFHFLRLQREFEINPTKKLEKEKTKFLKIELQNCEKADVIVPISEEDESALQHFYHKEKETVVIGNVHQFMDGNDESRSFGERKNILFIGGFAHKPNIDAVLYLHEKIMPLVLEKHPEIVFNIIGSYPTEEILNLQSSNFNILGFVEDVSNNFNESRLFVAPLAYGAGVKGKIGQSFEYGLPVVTTLIGAEGFDFAPYKNEMISTIDEPTIFTDKILQLYHNETLWKSASEQSFKILEPFSLKTIEKQVLKVIS